MPRAEAGLSDRYLDLSARALPDLYRSASKSSCSSNGSNSICVSNPSSVPPENAVKSQIWIRRLGLCFVAILRKRLKIPVAHKYYEWPPQSWPSYVERMDLNQLNARTPQEQNSLGFSQPVVSVRLTWDTSVSVSNSGSPLPQHQSTYFFLPLGTSDVSVSKSVPLSPRQSIYATFLPSLSNDDGYLAPGLACLARRWRPLGHLDVVAPERDRSGASNSLTLDRPLRVRPR